MSQPDNLGERVRFSLREWNFIGGWDTWVWVTHVPCNSVGTLVVTGDDFLMAVMEHQCSEQEGGTSDDLAQA